VSDGTTTAGGEVFALTDEQIVGLETEAASDEWRVASERESEVPGSGDSARNDGEGRDSSERPASEGDADRAGGVKPALENDGSVATQGKGDTRSQLLMVQPPEWLAARMMDPRDGEEAKELWDGKQRAEKEAAAYREVFATPEDARALKEIYPGGAGEAKAAAERARALDEIDAAFYRGDAAARMQLAQRMMAENAGAFRAMVEAGAQLLGGAGDTQQGEQRAAQAGAAVPPEVVRAYGEMERAANAELEKSVGGAIGKAMEQALPNLRQAARGQAGAQDGEPLQSRLAAAVREEVEAGLKSDRELSEQVARILAGKRFDEAARGQVVRLIDTRAQQLVPGAVKRIVGAWTQATLAARAQGNRSAEGPQMERRSAGHFVEKVGAKSGSERAAEQAAPTAARRGRRMDYTRFTDEEIVGM